MRQNATLTLHDDNSSIAIPEPLKPNDNVLSWCLPSFIVEGVELRGGRLSRVFLLFWWVVVQQNSRGTIISEGLCISLKSRLFD